MPSVLPPRPPQYCAHRRTLENSLWLYCSSAEQTASYMLSILFTIYKNSLMLLMHCTAAYLFGIKHLCLSYVSNVFVTPHTSPPPPTSAPPPQLRPPPSLGASAARHPRVTETVYLRLCGTKRRPNQPPLYFNVWVGLELCQL